MGENRSYCAALAAGAQFDFEAWIELSDLTKGMRFNVDFSYFDLTGKRHETGLVFIAHLEDGSLRPVYERVEYVT